MMSASIEPTREWPWPHVLLDAWRDSAPWWRASRASRLNEFIKQIEQTSLRRPRIAAPPAWVFRWVVASAGFRPRWRRQRCLIRCLLVYYLLIRARQEAVLHFGCRVDQAGFFAHCWLTSACNRFPPGLQHPGATQEIAARAYQGSKKGFIWQTSYSQTSVTERASSASPGKKSPGPAELSLPTSPGST